MHLASHKAAIVLAPDYYLTNFRVLISHVVSIYSDLLTLEERGFYNAFVEIDDDAQKLLVRMLMRKGCRFRADKLIYQEIADTRCAANQLQQAGLIHIGGINNLQELLPLFSKAEWLQQLASYTGAGFRLAELKLLKRQQFDRALASLPAEICAHLQRPKTSIYTLCCDTQFDTFKLLFFGRLHQDLSDFVARDLGHVRYEDYAIDVNARLFRSREQVEQHLCYYRLVDGADQCMADGRDAMLALYHQLPPPNDHDQTLNRRLQRLQLQLARQLERQGYLQDAMVLYQTCFMPPSRERQVRILAKQQPEQAFALCAAMLEQPLCDEEAVFAERFANKLAVKLKRPRRASTPYQPACEPLCLPYTEERVELAVARHLAGAGDCYWVENHLFCTLFALHHWDLLFAPVPGAFTHPFQAAPHDLYENDFLKPRQALWQAADRALDAIPYNTDKYLTLWREKHGIANPFVAWDYLAPTVIVYALQRIPATDWRSVFRRFWQDLRSNRSGLPDLIFFPRTGGYQLLEVKGPGDRLQPNQQRWMHYFSQCGIAHKVVQVTWHEQ